MPPPPTSISGETNNNNSLNDCQVVDLQADMPAAGVGGGGTGDTSELLTELYDDVMQCVYDDVASTGLATYLISLC